MECKNIEILHEDFTGIEPTDHKLQKVKVILLLPRCSSLGVSNPVEFILNEHEDADLLRDFSQGCVAEDKLNVLAEQQLKELTRAMQFSKVQAVVYCTCSVYPEENEAVINKALTSGAEGAKAQPYKLCPPVLPLCCKSEINTSAENFFKLELSDISNSCFLAVLARERDPSETVSVKDVLARAAAKGLLEGFDLAKPPKREKKKKQKVTPTKTPSKDAAIQSKIQEFLEREMKPNKIDSGSSVSNAIAGTTQKTISPTNDSAHLKKGAKPVSNSSLPVMLKVAPTSSFTQKALERQRTVKKPKSEEKMMVLKPVEIVLPPVMMPYFNPQGNRSQISSNHYYYHWFGRKSGLYDPLSPSASKKLIKSKEPSSSSTGKHVRPWL
uniref:Uncharacterized protein n=2 Tax=Sphaerodactylus townsendi TaxID=933632 RepID=A0ACB8E6Y9_9SAUR